MWKPIIRNLFKNIVLFIIIFFYLFVQPTFAKWSTKEDALTEYDFYYEDIKINKDGTWQKTVEFKQKLLKEAARDQLTIYRMLYNQNTEEIDIIEAKTVKNGEQYEVDHKKIEDKSLFSSTKGFDQKRQILIPFTQIEVGSSIYLKYKIKVNKVPLENHFSDCFYFGLGGYVKDDKITLSSEIPLYMRVNDPRNILNIQKDKGGDKLLHKITINIKRPFISDTINEIGQGLVNEKYLIWVNVSSDNNWSTIGNKLGIKYDEVINQKLPVKFQNILNLVKKEKTDIDKINKATELIQDTLQYLGDWQTIDGKFFPRDLSIIEKTQLGDCKDFATALAAILNKLGYKANVAAVIRGVIVSDNSDKLPGLLFNHVIVYVVDKNGKEYWIDPTNQMSMAGNIFPDIADRSALILDSKKSNYTKIPAVDYKNSITKINQEYIIKQNMINKKVSIDILGESAEPYTALNFYLTNDVIADKFYHMLEDKEISDKNKNETIIPKLDSRIVKDLRFEFDYNLQNPFLKTNLGKGIPLSYDNLKVFLDTSIHNIQDNFIGNQRTMVRKTLIKGVKIKNIDSLNYNIDTPWIKISRKCKIFDDNTAEIDDKYEVLKSYITSEELKSIEYKNLKSGLEENYKDVAVLFH